MSLFKPSSTGQLRLARYKPNGNPGSEVLYAEHTDYNSFTFLWRNRTNGLQAKLNGSWTPIPLLPDHPDALLVNLGDLMEVWTGGVWKSPRHQVLDLKTYFDIFLCWKKIPLSLSPGSSLRPRTRRASFHCLVLRFLS